MRAPAGVGAPRESELPPRIEILKLSASAEEVLVGLAVGMVHGGRLDLRCAREGRRALGEGVVCALLPGASCRLRGPAAGAELLVFRAGAVWLEHACALAGRPFPTDPGGAGVERAGTDLARRVSHALRRLAAPRGDAIREAALRETAVQLELAAFALEVVGRRDEIPASPRRRSALRGDLHRAVSELRTAPLDGLSLRGLAERLGCSERQLSRLFLEEMGITFREWATSLRIERACRLLSVGPLSVTEVAAETGWSSLAHFNDAFRRRVGRTPSAYRASVLAAQ